MAFVGAAIDANGPTTATVLREFVGAVQTAIRACRRSYSFRISGNLCQSIFLPDREV
jgi:hypothetical protein